MKNKNNLNLVIIVFIFMIIACACPKPQDRSTTDAPAPISAETPTATNSSIPSNASANTDAKTTAGVNLANFNLIKTGMKYEDVVKILGKEGEVLSETEMAGYKTVVYKWDGSGLGANLNAIFQNGKLISKSQYGLK